MLQYDLNKTLLLPFLYWHVQTFQLQSSVQVLAAVELIKKKFLLVEKLCFANTRISHYYFVLYLVETWFWIGTCSAVYVSKSLSWNNNFCAFAAVWLDKCLPYCRCKTARQRSMSSHGPRQSCVGPVKLFFVFTRTTMVQNLGTLAVPRGVSEGQCFARNCGLWDCNSTIEVAEILRKRNLTW